MSQDQGPKEQLHSLKCWPVYYQPILKGDKPFDVRQGTDRDFKVGDYLDFREWDPRTEAFTGAQCVRRITYVMRGSPFLPPDTWVLGLSRERYT